MGSKNVFFLINSLTTNRILLLSAFVADCFEPVYELENELKVTNEPGASNIATMANFIQKDTPVVFSLES